MTGRIATALAFFAAVCVARAEVPVAYYSYLQAHAGNTAWTRLDFRPRGDSVIDTTFANSVGNVSGPVFAAWGTNSTDRAFTLYYYCWDTFNRYYGNKNWQGSISSSYRYQQVRYRLSPHGFWVNGVRHASFDVSPQDFGESNQLILFSGATATDGTPTSDGSYGNVQLQSMKCYNDDGETLCADLYPCKDADGKYGLYDIVSRTIYRNLGVGGSGKEFTVGSEVTGPKDSIVVLSTDGRRYGTVEPAYGTTNAPAAGATAFVCSTPSVELVDKPGVFARCTGWKLYSVLDNSLIKSSADEGASETSFTHDYETGHGVIVEWAWTKAYLFRAAATSGGTVSHTATTNRYEAAETVTVTATPASGYRFAGWKGAAEADRTTNPLAVTVGTSVVDLTAVFELETPGAQTAVYAAADALPGGDGTSWARAYADIYTAVTNANALGLPLHAAGGIYIVTSTLSVTNIPAIYGGFAGTNDAETVADRRTDVCLTVLTGDCELNDCWAHVVPGLDGNFGYRYEALYDKPMVRNGAFNLPPAFTGDYDLYLPHVRGTNTGAAMYVKNGVAGVIDGLTFSSFAGSYVFQFGAGKRTDLTNCRFVGNKPFTGCIVNSDTSTWKLADGCQILYNRAHDVLQSSYAACVSGIAFGTAGLTVKNLTCLSCGFLNESATYMSSSHTFMTIGVGLNWAFGLNNTLTNCRFERMYTRAAKESCGGLCSGQYASFRFRDCSFVNMLSVVATAGLYIQTFPGCNSECIGCSFEGNRYEVNLGSTGSVWLFGDHVNTDQFRHSYDSCSFVRNSVYATGSTKTSGSVLVSLMGGNAVGNGITDGHRAQFVNCVFDSNEAKANLPDGVTPVLCRGVWNRCYTANTTGSAGIANCTFIGPKADGVCDVVQASDAHTKTFNIVNSHFQYTGGEPYTNGFSFAKASLVKLYSCTLANYVTPDEEYAISSHAYDPLVFVTNRVGANSRPVLVPAAVTPDFGKAADLVYNGSSFSASSSEKLKSGFMTNYAFRATSDASWQVLMTNAKDLDSDVAKNPSKYVMTDACGANRPLGGATRGAVQTPTSLAQTGASLTLRRTPFDAGFFEGPQVQCVAAGTAITPVKAVVAEGATAEFAGWYTTNDVLYSSSATLEIPELDESLVLVAKFAVPKTKIRFALGAYGTFDDTGLSTNLCEVAPGSEFPACPKFTTKPGWVFADWDKEFPAVTPSVDTIYTARFVTTDLRIIRCVPSGEAGEVQDGLTWATAFGDVAKAYKEAGICRGEVWVKTGVHRIKEAIPLKSNVAVRGGFAGTETSADEADSESHPSILSGDTSANDSWISQGGSGAGAVWTGTSFNTPAPDFVTDFRWTVGSATEDTQYCFLGSETCTNVSFSGLTFTCFLRSAVYDSVGGETPLVVTNCRFLANNTGDTAWYAALIVNKRTTQIEDSSFVGNNGAVVLSGGGTAVTNRIFRCSFDANRSTANDGGTAGLSLGGASTSVAGCRISRSFAEPNNYSQAVGSLSIGIGSGLFVDFTDCAFASNRVSKLARADVQKTGDGALSFTRCRFDDIRCSETSWNTWENLLYQSILFKVDGGTLMVRDSAFSRCVARSGGSANNWVVGAVLTASGGTSQFVNDTFDDCNAVSSNYRAGVFGLRGASAKVGVVNCLFNGTNAGGTQGGLVVADADSAALSFNVLNTAVVNSSNDFKAVNLANSAACLGFADSSVDGLDETALPHGSNGYFYNVESNAVLEVCKLEHGQNGAWGRRVRGEKRGRQVWLKDGTVYFLDAVANPEKPWRKAADKSFFAASVEGLSSSSEPVPNAFGEHRRSPRSRFGAATARIGFAVVVW